MTPSQRIAINAVATYTRTLFATGLALFSIRWVLNALGQTDYGLLSVVGSIICFITFLNSVLAGSASRHFAFHIGLSNVSEVTLWFNTTLRAHICFAVLLVVFGWPAGEYVVGHVLVVPVDRIAACRSIFRISLISAFVSMISVPFVAMFTAKQRITEIAAWGIFQSLLCFTLAWFLRYTSYDRLLFYSIGMGAIFVFVQSAQIYRAVTIFDECKIVYNQLFETHRFKKLFSFAIWNLIGSSGGLFRDQGSAILLNLYFGPSVNAAYGIATQVSSQTNQLSAAMIGAFSPEMTTCEGRGDRERMLSLSLSASKIGTILVLLLAIPLMVEMDYALKLWLHAPPPFASVFCKLILCSFLIDRLSTGYMLAINANGKIAAYQATLGTILLLTLPLAWLFLDIFNEPTCVGIAFIITMAVTSLGRVLWGRYLLGIPVRSWLITVVWPCVKVALVAAITALTPCWLLQPSFFRFVLVITFSLLNSLLAVWFLALETKEHELLRKIIRQLLDTLRVWNHSFRVFCDELYRKNGSP